MIFEVAIFNIKPGQQAAFEAAYAQAQKLLAAATGYRAHELRKCIEEDHRYLLQVQWNTLEDHTEGFRGSPAFASWRGLIGPFFDSPPVVEHYHAIDVTPQS